MNKRRNIWPSHVTVALGKAINHIDLCVFASIKLEPFVSFFICMYYYLLIIFDVSTHMQYRWQWFFFWIECARITKFVQVNENNNQEKKKVSFGLRTADEMSSESIFLSFQPIRPYSMDSTNQINSCSANSIIIIIYNMPVSYSLNRLIRCMSKWRKRLHVPFASFHFIQKWRNSVVGVRSSSFILIPKQNKQSKKSKDTNISATFTRHQKGFIFMSDAVMSSKIPLPNVISSSGE